MKCEWKYFIVLCTDDCYGDFVEDEEDSDELPVCVDVTVAKSFPNPDLLIKWVEEKTSLKLMDYKIEGQYLPVDL